MSADGKQEHGNRKLRVGRAGTFYSFDLPASLYAFLASQIHHRGPKWAILIINRVVLGSVNHTRFIKFVPQWNTAIWMITNGKSDSPAATFLVEHNFRRECTRFLARLLMAERANSSRTSSLSRAESTCD